MLESRIIPWIREVAAGAPFIFQQNEAPAHTSQVVQFFLHAELGPDRFWSKEKWPLLSPDLNPCDYFLWGAVEREADGARPPDPSVGPAKDPVTSSGDRDAVSQACERLKKANYFE